VGVCMYGFCNVWVCVNTERQICREMTRNSSLAGKETCIA